MSEFFREPTTEERKQFRVIDSNQPETIGKIFRRKLVDKQQECTIKRKPFCFRCAKFDFEKWASNNVKAMERAVGFTDFNELKEDLPELSTYEEADRFEYVKEQKAMEPVFGAQTAIAEGKIVRQIQIGFHRDYKCKKCGGQISIFVSNEDIENEKVSNMPKSKAKPEQSGA